MPSIGIIGAGNIGRAIATALARKDIAATLANSRGPESLADAVGAIGPAITAGTREDAAAKDIVFVAVNWSKLPQALGGLPLSMVASLSTRTTRSRRRCSSRSISAAGPRPKSSPTWCPARAW